MYIFIFMPDKRSRYYKIEKVMNLIKDMEKIHLSKLQGIIFKEIGCSEKLIAEVIKSMIGMGYIKEIDHLIFEINAN